VLSKYAWTILLVQFLHVTVYCTILLHKLRFLAYRNAHFLTWASIFKTGGSGAGAQIPLKLQTRHVRDSSDHFIKLLSFTLIADYFAISSRRIKRRKKVSSGTKVAGEQNLLFLQLKQLGGRPLAVHPMIEAHNVWCNDDWCFFCIKCSLVGLVDNSYDTTKVTASVGLGLLASNSGTNCARRDYSRGFQNDRRRIEMTHSDW